MKKSKMKLRYGFVSNSSSSSFIVPIMNSIETVNYSRLQHYFEVDEEVCWDGETRKVYSIVLPIESGVHRFDWEETTYDSFASKLNYLIIQIEGLENTRLRDTLKDKLREALKSICRKAYNEESIYSFDVLIDYNKFKWDSIYNYAELYNIDHQSTWYESEDIVSSYFKTHKPDVSLIENYLVGDSYIQGGNDNDDMSADYHESLDILKRYKSEQQKAVD